MAAAPPGIRIMTLSTPAGSLVITEHFDPDTYAYVNDPQAVAVDNTTGKVNVLHVVRNSDQADRTFNIPTGVVTVTVAQLAAKQITQLNDAYVTTDGV